MNRKRVMYVLAWVTLLLALSMIPVFSDPYEHKERVCFWVWLWRELDELQHGEKT